MAGRTRSGLGLNITADLMNDFFSLKPNTSSLSNDQTKFVKHHVGSSQFVSTANSGIQTPRYHFDTSYYEQQMKLGGGINEDEDEFDFPVHQPVEENEMLLPEPDDSEVPPDNQEISIEIYDNYKFDHVYDNSLPITLEQERVIQTIETNRVTVVQGSTGSGKTTQVPQYILDYYHQRRKYCNILVTQPRRIAAMSVAKRVSGERKWPLGTLVGYQVGRERKVTEDTRITYMTTGVLLQKLIKNKNLGEYTHVILDEVHERDQDIDFAMLVVRKYLRTVSRHVKVVLMSATVDSSLFSNYFSILINGKKEGAPVISVEGKMYDVMEYYNDDVLSFAELPQQSIYEPEITERVYRLCRELIMQLDKDELQEDPKPGQFAKTRGTVLCFLPGLPEITKMHEYLADIEDKKKLKILPLHSQITSNEQNRVFYRAEPFERKVILSTNIAESSVTVPDIKYVVDFCLTKNLETDGETNYQRLTLQWASKASLTQRKGRAGRVSDGHCFRLISHYLHKQLPEYCIPELLRSPLEQVVLKVKLLELGPPAMILQLAMQPPDINNIKRTILMLKEVGALTVRQNGKINPLDGDLTFVGRVLGSLPVDVHIGKLLLIGYTFGVLEECLIISACLSLKSIFSRPFKNDLKAYSNKMHWAKNSTSDLLASFNAFLEWKFCKERTGFGEAETSWAKKKLLEHKRFAEVDELVKELRNRLYQHNITSERNIFKRNELNKEDELIVKMTICAAFFPNYSETQEIDESEANKVLSGQNPFTTVVVHGAPPTLCHYRSRVAQLFRQCGTGKRMYFENTRAFIEFESNIESETKVAPAVYKAIKMRQLRTPLNILVSKERDEEIRSKLVKKPLESYNPETGLRSHRLNTGFQREDKISVTMQGNIRQLKMQDSGYINLFIQEIINVGHFWATYADQETRVLMNQLHTKINCLGGRNLKVLDREDIKIGTYCLALFEDEFFRAEIIGTSQFHVKVFFVDYGNTHNIMDYNQLRKISESLLEIPFQAFGCFLSEVRPVHGKWSEEALAWFAVNCPVGEKQFIGKIYCQLHDTYRLELMDNDININKQLIAEGYAMYCEETAAAKARHDIQQSEPRVAKETNPSQIIRDAAEIRQNEEVLKITLRGPFSPYERTFFGLTASGRLRSTNIEQDSVNSVVICEEPQDKHSILMVAASININQSGNTMILRETTMMPNIHGLTSLVPLLFAPVAEFRMNRKRTKYTGAICGLGSDDTGGPILPDHDIEVVFDIHFDNDDISLINSVRHLINTAIGIETEKIEHPARIVSEIQKLTRVKLLELINKQRDDMEVATSRTEYRWKQVPEDLILVTGHEEKPHHLYMYHHGILFEEEERQVDPRILEMQKQLAELHKMAGRSIIPFKKEVVCPTCQVRCAHPRALYLHIETQLHQGWQSKFFKTEG